MERNQNSVERNQNTMERNRNVNNRDSRDHVSRTQWNAMNAMELSTPRFGVDMLKFRCMVRSPKKVTPNQTEIQSCANVSYQRDTTAETTFLVPKNDVESK